MPKSRKRKVKKPGGQSRSRPASKVESRPGYTPTALPDSTNGTMDRLWNCPPQWLPTVGVAEWHLVSSPMRKANQCVAATWVVKVAMQHFGLKAEPVGLLLDAQAPDGTTTRYGNQEPHMDGHRVVGHVGLVGDDMFIDPTASQFPEVEAHGGVRVVGGPLQPGMAEQILARGARMWMRLADKHQVLYTVMPEGSADPVMLPAVEHEGNDIAKIAHNLVLGYSVFLAREPFLTRVESLREPRYALFVSRVRAMKGHWVEMGSDGVFRVT